MKIHKNQIPQEGLILEGELEVELLKPGEGILRQTGPLRYCLDCGANNDGFWALGSLSLPVEFECVRCLDSFVTEIHVPNFVTQLPWETGDLVDLTLAFREDIFLILPNYPDCQRDGGLECPGFGTLPPVATGNLEASGKVLSGNSPWKRLDALKLKNGKA